MAKKSVKMITSAAILGILLGSYYGIKTYVDELENNENMQQEEIINVFSCDYDDVTKISFLAGDDTLTFEKVDEQWLYTADEKFPVKQSELEDSIGVISELNAEMKIDNVEDANLYELGNPTNVLTIETSDGQETTLTYGMKNTSTEQYYLMLNDDSRVVYVVDSIYAEAFEKELYDFAEENEFPDIDTSMIEKINMEKEDEKYSLERDQHSGLWYVSSDDYKEEKADSSYAQNVFSTIGSLEYKEFVNYDCKDDTEYGLDNPYAVITVKYQEEITAEEDGLIDETEQNEKIEEAEGEEQDIEEQNIEKQNIEKQEDDVEEISLEDKQLVLLIGDETGMSSRYVKIEGKAEVYTISNSLLEIFTEKNAEDFLDLTVSYVAMNDLSQIRVEYDSKEYVVDVSRETSVDEDGEEETEMTYRLNGKKIEDSIDFTTFYNKTIGMVGESRIDLPYEDEMATVLDIEFETLNGEIKTVSYYEYDSSYYVAVTDEKAYMVNKSDVTELINSFELFIEMKNDEEKD